MSRTREAAAQVLRDFRAPEGTAPGELDANGDGEVLCVLDLRVDDSLQARALDMDTSSPPPAAPTPKKIGCAGPASGQGCCQGSCLALLP